MPGVRDTKMNEATLVKDLPQDLGAWGVGTGVCQSKSRCSWLSSAQNPDASVPGFSNKQMSKFNSGATALALHRAKPRLRSASRCVPSTCLSAGTPDLEPTYFAAVTDAEEVIPEHLHGASPSGVDESPSEDVR